MLLSQDHINRLIQPDAGVAELELPLDDEEFVTNYVALLKAISVRLSKDTVRFFDDTLTLCFRVLFWRVFTGVFRHVFQLVFSTCIPACSVAHSRGMSFASDANIVYMRIFGAFFGGHF